MKPTNRKPAPQTAAENSATKPENGMEYLRSVIRAHSKDGSISLDELVGALDQAAETPDGAAAIEEVEAEADAEAHRMMYPEEYEDDDQPRYSGREVHELCRQAEIDSAAVTAFDIVRLFIRECCNAEAGLALCAVAAKFAHRQPEA